VGNRKPAKGEFSDSFRKFASQQPQMVDAMHLAPGVHLSERGRTKAGSDIRDTKMTRKDYSSMVERGAGVSAGADDRGGRPGQQAGAGPDKSGGEFSLPAPDTGYPGGAAGGTRETPAGAAGQVDGAGSEVLAPVREGGTVVRDARSNFKVVRGEDFGANLLPQAPATPRPVQPVPPPVKRMSMKRDALGYMLSSRERVATATGSRYPNCAAQPPLGATMGHGLHTHGQKYEEYFFPDAKDVGPSFTEDDVGSAVGQALATGDTPLQSPRQEQNGVLVSKNPELARRLFAR